VRGAAELTQQEERVCRNQSWVAAARRHLLHAGREQLAALRRFEMS
jgi:hypothetical protein